MLFHRSVTVRMTGPVLLGVLVLAGKVWCQQQPITGGVGGFGGPAGVFIDPQGVLRFREVDRGGRLRKPKGDERLVYVSLPRLFEHVRKLRDAGQEIPDRLRYLEGMVKLRYVFLYPGTDLVIAGPAEDWDTASQWRPLGSRTGRPVLQLDDLVVALRTAGPNRPRQPFGCSIDVTQEALDRVVQEAQRLGSVRSGGSSRVADSLAKAAGLQPVRFFGIAPDTRMAFTCLEADYLMKRLSLGLMRSPVRSVRSHLSMLQKGESIYNRWWFVERYEPLLVSEAGDAYEIRGQGVGVLASSAPPGAGAPGGPPPSPSARQFAQDMTDHFVELAQAEAAFADLWNVTDLAVLAALISHDRLHERAGWDLGWLVDSEGFPVRQIPVPKSAESLANHRTDARSVRFVVGGAVMAPDNAVARRETDATGQLKEQAQRPPDGWSLAVP